MVLEGFGKSTGSWEWQSEVSHAMYKEYFCSFFLNTIFRTLTNLKVSKNQFVCQVKWKYKIKNLKDH